MHRCMIPLSEGLLSFEYLEVGAVDHRNKFYVNYVTAVLYQKRKRKDTVEVVRL